MQDRRKFYIDGAWVEPEEADDLEVINPATEEPIGVISRGTAKDVDRAVAAARSAFKSYGKASREERAALLEKIIDVYKSRYDEIAEAISLELGAPIWLSKAAHAATGTAHFKQALAVLKGYSFEEDKGTTRIVKEPIGVCGFISPWNWPINQVVCKVAPAIAAGCTMVLKPSVITPLNACLLADVLDEAGVPPGVFNLVNGAGSKVGQAISAHPDVDMVSFTGSTGAGVQVAMAAADSVKRVTQELGGKSANIILDDADLKSAVAGGVRGCFVNSGQSCNAPTRMLVSRARHDEAVEIAVATAEKHTVGEPFAEGTKIGPVVSEAQFDKIQGLIEKGVEEGATLAAGGPGRPEGVNRGYYVRPTVFANVSNDMTIAREEIFGPVLAILPYGDEEEAIRVANDSPYGLSGYVSSGDLDHAHRVAGRMRTGNVHVNGAGPDFAAPFGGYKRSGNGREWGEYGFEEFLEVKAVMGWSEAEK